jgi:peptidoglycan/LPS O-acetylase OafA/YrhL
MPGLTLSALNGHLGVDLFFIISGFVIFMSLERSKDATDFAVSRFARLYPPYVVCACLTVSVIVLGHFNPFRLTVIDALLNLTMLNKAQGNIPIDSTYWTLTYEVHFYALAAIAYFLLRIRRIEWACLVWLGVALVARISGFNDAHVRYGVLLGVNFCHLFILGMLIYLVWQRRHTWLTLVTALLAFGMTFFGPTQNPGHLRIWQFVALTGIFVLGVWLAAEDRLKVLNIRPLVFLGEISYSLYLVHAIAGYWLIRKLESWNWIPDAAVLSTVLVAIVVATALRRLVEVPARRAIRNYYRNATRVPVPMVAA